MVKGKAAKKDKPFKNVAQYIGQPEVYFPGFNKIINHGDLLPELSLKEAESRSDFIVVLRKD